MNHFTDYVKAKCVNRVIDLSDCKLGFRSMVILTEIIKINDDNFSKLILSKNNFNDDCIELLINSIRENNNIIELNLSSNGMTPKGGNLLFEFLLNQNSIISFDISSSDGINRNRICAEGVKLIEEVLKKNLFLEFIDISSNSIKTEGFKYLINGLDGNKTLKYLNISNNEIEIRGINYLLNHKNFECKIEFLDISYNPIGNNGIGLFGKCLSEKRFTELKHINLTECSFNFTGFSVFIKNIGVSKKLNFMILNRNNLYSLKWEYLESKFISLNLRYLSLSSCQLNNSVSCIAKIFIHHPTLKILDLSHNQINDSSFVSFQQYPKENLCLIEVDFSRNFISDKSGKKFFENLIHNRFLQKLNFYDNQLMNASANAVIESLRVNKNLISVNFNSNRVPIRIMKEINSRLAVNKFIERGKFMPHLKQELKNLSFDPSEIHSLKNKIVNLSNERELHSKKLSADKKMTTKNYKIDENNKNEVISKNNKLLKELEELKKNFDIFNNDRENYIKNIYDVTSEIKEKISDMQRTIKNIEIDKESIIEKQDKDLENIRKKYDDKQKEYQKVCDKVSMYKERLNEKISELKEKMIQLDKIENPEKYSNYEDGNKTNVEEEKEAAIRNKIRRGSLPSFRMSMRKKRRSVSSKSIEKDPKWNKKLIK